MIAAVADFLRKTLVLCWILGITVACASDVREGDEQRDLGRGRLTHDYHVGGGCYPTHSYTDRYGCNCDCECCHYHSSVECNCHCHCTSKRNLLNIRFNKIPPSPDSSYSRNIFPLYAKDYPISKETALILRTETLGDSIVIADDYELYGVDADDYIAKVGGRPSMPASDPNHEFWDELRHVVHVQLARRSNADPALLNRWPNLWSDFDIHDCAEAVHNEFPGTHPQELIKWILASGEIEMDYDIIPFRSKRDFVGLQLRLSELNTWAVGSVGATCFYMKWAVGRPRPEEVVWLISTGALTVADGVPKDLVRKIRSMDLRSANEFTAYPEGSPTHPAWPAMHAAGSCVSLVLAVVLNLTPRQYCEALRLDYAVAYGRTVAGVHYPMDNIAGLNLGKEILLDKLADHLAEKYGSDRDKVQKKLERYSFDWADFDPEDCSIAGRKNYLLL